MGRAGGAVISAKRISDSPFSCLEEKNKMLKKIYLNMFLLLLVAAPVSAQKLTKEQLIEKSNALYVSGRQKDAIDLINQHPEFANENEILYVRSVAYTELRDYENADIAFQKQFDLFLKNGTDSLTIAEEYEVKSAPTKLDKEMAAMMYATAIISFASADLTNSLRAVAFGKNGMPEARRSPKNLAGFDEFKKLFEETAIKSGEMNLKNNQLNDALANFNKAVELNPQNAATYSGRAKVYRKLKKLKLAAADEAKARRLAAKM